MLTPDTSAAQPKSPRLPTARRPGASVLMSVALLVLGWVSAVAGAAQDPSGVRRVEISTRAGSIEIDLEPQAAPRAVSRLLRLFESAGAAGSPGSWFDGAAIDHTWPLVEVGIATRPPEEVELIRFEQEIDANTLGLDRVTIANAGEAMDVWQFELAEADQKWKASGGRPPRYLEWLEQWESTGQPDFLVGVSRMELNEVLGYRYQKGLASRPARRGAVYLDPISPTMVSPGLVILLSDRKALDGRVTVVGTVSRGLDVAEKISQRPLVVERGKQTKRPLDPVTILEIRVVDGEPGDSVDEPRGTPE